MNLKVLQWLLRHKDALLQIVEIAKGYNKQLPYLKQWEIADKIARIVIPILEAESITPKALSVGGLYDFSDDWDHEGEPRDYQVLSAGSDVHALGIDWKLLVETIVPLVVAILRALLKDDQE